MKREGKPRLQSIGTCGTCGKQQYATRRIAKDAARAMSRTDMSTYKCGNYWHLGHLPRWVIEGSMTRDDIPRLLPPDRFD